MITDNLEYLKLYREVVAEITRLSHRDFNKESYFETDGFWSESQLEDLKKMADALHLPARAREGIDFGKTIEENPYRFLFEKNLYLKLFQFLHGETFRKLQTYYLQLYMGIFAYIDRESSELRYLLSSQGLDKGKEPPHFFLAAHYFDGDQKAYFPEQPPHLETIHKVFYVSKKSQRPDYINFVNILRDSPVFKNKRTQFEKVQELIYIPSGEIDSCLLCWFLLSQENDVRWSLHEALQPARGVSEIWAQTKAISFCIDWDIIQRGAFPKSQERIDYPYANYQYDLWRWMEKFGLLNEQEHDAPQLTERGKRMLHWFYSYIRCQHARDKDNELYELLERIQNNGNTSDYWFETSSVKFIYRLQNHFSLDLSDFEDRVQGFIDAFEAGQAEPETRRDLDLLTKMLAILILWDEKTSNRELRLSHFKDRCRFDLIGHFVLRAANRAIVRQPANASRGWLVFPILRDFNARVAGRPEGQIDIVGFFLGAFKDSNDEGRGFFESLYDEDESLKRDFTRLLRDLRTVIEILARVENRAIYYNDIKRQVEQYKIDTENERMFAHANKYLMGSLVADANRLESGIRALKSPEVRPLFEIARDYGLKARLIKKNDSLREVLSKATGDVRDYNTVSVKLLTFFQYLFIIEKFNSEKLTLKIDYSDDTVHKIEKVLFLEDFSELPGLRADIRSIFQLLFEANNYFLRIPKDMYIRLPIENQKAMAFFYFNFHELIHNYFKYWVGEPLPEAMYYLHVSSASEANTLYILQSKKGAGLDQRYYYDENKGIHKYRTTTGFKWAPLSKEKENIGIRNIRRFFETLFQSNYVLERHRFKIRELKEGVPQERSEYLVIQRIQNLSERLIYIKDGTV